MRVHELQQQHRKKMIEMFRCKQPAGGSVLTTIKPAAEMLMDDRFGDATAQALTICLASAHGLAERQECFCCLRPWSAERWPESIGCAEFIERPDAEAAYALTFGICWSCSFDRPAVLAALKRDFGDFAELSNTPGTA